MNPSISDEEAAKYEQLALDQAEEEYHERRYRERMAKEGEVQR